MGNSVRYCPKGHDKDLPQGRNKNGECRKCRSTIYNKKYSNREYKLIKNHNLTLSQYNELFVKQNGLCLGCYRHASQLKSYLRVDHCHKTGRIRGLLCNSCNLAIGMLLDSPETLTRLADYLKLVEGSPK